MIERSGADVELLGFRSGHELAAAVQASAAVVMPSICHDNCPLAVIEAMAWGKPVIGSRVGGIPELVRDGHEGVLVPHGDVRAPWARRCCEYRTIRSDRSGWAGPAASG